MTTQQLKQETAPASEPLTLTEAKDYLKVSGADDDTLISNLIVAARQAAEKFLKISLISQSWKLSYDQYAPSVIILPMGRAQSITSVKAISRDESTTDISSSTYYLSAGNQNLVFEATVVSHRVEIIYVSGYGASASDVPYAIRQGMLAHIAAIYDGRAGGNVIPWQSKEFYSPYRVVRV